LNLEELNLNYFESELEKYYLIYGGMERLKMKRLIFLHKLRDLIAVCNRKYSTDTFITKHKSKFYFNSNPVNKSVITLIRNKQISRSKKILELQQGEI
jgi:hypothetical protein